jgi:hypothetical protein
MHAGASAAPSWRGGHSIHPLSEVDRMTYPTITEKRRHGQQETVYRPSPRARWQEGADVLIDACDRDGIRADLAAAGLL